MRKKLITYMLLITFFIGTYFVNLGTADSFAPVWLKEGTYATYTTDRVGYAYILNNSSPTGNDVLSFWNGTLTWRCISINNTIAKLAVTFDYVGKELNHVTLNNASLQLSGEVYVDLYTRAVYASNGSLLGTTHLWLPANPAEGQEVVVWDIPPDRIVLQAKINSIWFQTIQGKQDGFQVDGTGNIKDKQTNFGLLCDLDTGLNMDGSFENEPAIASMGITALLLNGHVILSDTNISLEPTNDSFNWFLVLPFATLPIAFFVLFAAIYRHKHIRKKH